MAPDPQEPAGPDALSRAESIYAERVRQLYRLSRPAYGGLLLCAAVAVAALWGVVAPLALLTLAPGHQAFLAFLIPAVLPVIPTVFLQGTTTHFYLGVLLLVFLVVMFGTGPLITSVIREALSTTFEKDELATRLAETQAASRLAKSQFNEQVYAQRVMAEELRQASQKVGALIEASPLAIIVCDVQGRVESWNRAAENIFGWTQGEVRGAAAPFLPPGREAEAEHMRRKILNRETVSGVETVHVRKDGTLVDVSISASLVHDVASRPIGYLTMFADITERKRVEKQQNVMTQIRCCSPRRKASKMRFRGCSRRCAAPSTSSTVHAGCSTSRTSCCAARKHGACRSRN